MSKRKFLNEISMMTHNGVYPSLKILLEKNEDTENPDLSFEDENEVESDTEAGPDTEVEESDTEVEEPDDTEAGPDDIESAANIAQGADLNALTNILAKVAANNPDTTGKSIDDEYFSKSVDPSKFLRNANYSLESFVLLNEKDNLEKAIEDAVEVIEKKQDDIEKIELYVKGIENKGKYEKVNVDDIVNKAYEVGDNFEFHYDPWSIVGSDASKAIISISKPEEEQKNVEEFIEKYAKKLDHENKDHSININTIEQSDYNTAAGGKASS